MRKLISSEARSCRCVPAADSPPVLGDIRCVSGTNRRLFWSGSTEPLVVAEQRLPNNHMPPTDGPHLAVFPARQERWFEHLAGGLARR